MKFRVLLLFVLCFLNSSVYSQLQQDYPFKTYVDNAGNLYVTGNTTNSGGELFFSIFSLAGAPLYNETYQLSPGLASKGMDIIPSQNGTSVYIVGYGLKQPNSPFGFPDNDIIILKYTLGPTVTRDWVKTFDYDGKDDRALSMVIVDDIIYVTGYVSQANDESKDIVVLQVDPSVAYPTVLWPLESHTDGIDEIGTHILNDGNFLYIGGYKTQEDPDLHDMMLLSLSMDEETDPEIDVVSEPETDDYLTGIVLPEVSNSSVLKSKLGMVGCSISDPNQIGETESYITVYFDPAGTTIGRSWTETFGTYGETNRGTAITSDDNDNVIVTGYYFNTDTESGSVDFGTIKYNGTDGGFLWTPNVQYYNNNDGIDQASSIRMIGDKIATAGYSQFSANSFETDFLEDNSSSVTQQWSRSYAPDYLKSSSIGYNMHYAETYILSDGSVLTFVASTDGTVSQYSAVRYDSAGNKLYSLDEPGDQLTGRPHGELNTEPYSFELKQNYPNPFNPVTNISYTIPYNSFVELKIYDILGKEIAVLVNNVQDAGSHMRTFDASSLPSGIYFYRLTATSGSNRLVKVDKMVLAK